MVGFVFLKKENKKKLNIGTMEWISTKGNSRNSVVNRKKRVQMEMGPKRTKIISHFKRK